MAWQMFRCVLIKLGSILSAHMLISFFHVLGVVFILFHLFILAGMVGFSVDNNNEKTSLGFGLLFR